MTLSVATKVDDTNKAIVNASGVGEDSGTLYSSDKSISLANVYYEIRGNDYEEGIYPKVTLTLGDQTLVLEGFGNWGLKEGEARKVIDQKLDTATTLEVSADKEVSKFNLAVEVQKETEIGPLGSMSNS